MFRRIKNPSNFKTGVTGGIQRFLNPKAAFSGVPNAISRAGSNIQGAVTGAAQQVAGQALTGAVSGIPGAQQFLAGAVPTAQPVVYQPPMQQGPAGYPAAGAQPAPLAVPASAPPAEPTQTATVVPLTTGTYTLPPGTELFYEGTNGRMYPKKNYELHGPKPQAGGRRGSRKMSKARFSAKRTKRRSMRSKKSRRRR